MQYDPMRNDGAPSVLFSHSKSIARTRKAHVCMFCRGVIPAGSPACKTFVKLDDGNAYVEYTHDGKPGLDECHERVNGSNENF